MPAANNKQSKGRAHRALGALVLLSMFVAAVAFAAGLYVQGGIGAISSVIAGFALFFVMAASHTALIRSQAPNGSDPRVSSLEAALDRMSQDMERIRKAGEAGEQLEALAGRVDGLKRVVDKAERLGASVDAAALIKRLAGETERLDARLEALKNQTAIEIQGLKEGLSAEIQVLETLVKQLAERLAAEMESREQLAAQVSTKDEGGARSAQASPVPEFRPAPVQPGAVQARDGGDVGHEESSQPALSAEEIQVLLLEEVRRSIEANRIELYLQPIMIIPQRRIRYYEALTRLRTEAGRLLLPDDYLPLAESAGMMPVIDNVMLFRSVQVLRRLEKRSSARGVFCNVSVHSLLDAEFFQEFISFMEQNRELSESMYFEFNQQVINNCGPVELESLAALAGLGFRFSLDHVTDLDVDFQTLYSKGFRHLKISADVFLNGMVEAGARIHAADMKSYLERFGMQLIIEKIEDERTLTSVLDHHVRLGQGYLFSEPRPVRPEVFGGSEDAAAA